LKVLQKIVLIFQICHVIVQYLCIWNAGNDGLVYVYIVEYAKKARKAEKAKKAKKARKSENYKRGKKGL
jgi:hypothetical protein